jgi:hypothetical protein
MGFSLFDFGSDAPEYPEELMREQLDAATVAAQRDYDMSLQQQDWSQNMWDEQMFPMLQETNAVQTSIMQDTLNNGREDRARYEDVYQPLEDDLIQEFQDYDTPERRDLESGRAMGQAQQAFDAQRGNAEQRLASYGVDPSQLRAGAIDSQARSKLALGQAALGNQARQRVEDTGRALRAEAINIGRGMPSQVAGSYAQSLNAGNSAMGNTNNTMGQGANMMGTGQGWGQMHGNQTGQNMSGINNMYSGQLAGYDASGGMMGALGNIGGQVLGAWAGSGFAEGGGAVGEGQALLGSDLSATPGPNDAIPVTLAPNEYIIPADVAMVLGTEKLDKLIEKTREQAGERGGANANTPAGEMPNQETPIKGQTLAAEGGGAVGHMAPMTPEAIQMNMPVNPGWGYNMQGGDPFADYRAAKAMEAQNQQVDMGAAIQSGAATREAYDNRTGLPGKYREWKERRAGMTVPEVGVYKEQAAKSGAAGRKMAPASIGAAEGGGAVGMPGKQLAVY